jgi:hypothetical protein
MDPWEVMPAPHGPNYLGRDFGNIEWQCVLILGVTHGKNIFCERPRSPAPTRGATDAGSEATKHQA